MERTKLPPADSVRNVVPGHKWEFINFDKPAGQQDAASRKQVRVATMRAFRRKQRLEQIETFQKTQRDDLASGFDVVADPRHVSGTISVFESNHELPVRTQPSSTCPDSVEIPSSDVPNREPKASHSDEWKQENLDHLWEIVSLDTLDPCGSLSMGINQNDHYLLNHFISVLSPRPFRFKVKNGQSPIGTSWIYEVFRDKLLLEATLFNAAVHLDGLYKRPTSPITLRHRGNTISMVNRMLDSPDKASDSIIGAVALMAFSGNHTGEIQEMKIHMNALAQMVRIRGGLEQLGLGGILHMFISRLDLIIAALTMSAPEFSFFGNRERPKMAPVLQNQATISGFSIIGSLPDPLGGIFREIRQLMIMQENFGSEEVDKESIILFGKGRSSIFHRLLSCPDTITTEVADHALSSLYSPCRVAALLFVEYLLAGRRPRLDILNSFGYKLIQTLQRLAETPQVQLFWDGDTISSKIVLWVCFIGGLSSLNTPELQWYSTLIGHTITKLGINSWRELKCNLSQLLWTDMMDDEASRNLWEKVQKSLAQST